MPVHIQHVDAELRTEAPSPTATAPAASPSRGRSRELATLDRDLIDQLRPIVLEILREELALALLKG